MVTFSQFAAHMVASKKYMPPKVAAKIATAAKSRVLARYAEGRADYPLDFTDLFHMVEAVVGGK